MKLDIPIRPDEMAFYNMCLDTESELIKNIRVSLEKKDIAIIIPVQKQLNFRYIPNVSQVYISLFQEGIKSIRWGSRRESLEVTLSRCVRKLKEYQTFSDFEIYNPDKCRILVEIITDEQPCDIRELTQNTLDENRFEVGIDGLKLSFDNNEYFYLPTDANIKSHLSLKDVLNFFAKKIGLSKYTTSISKRIEMLKLLDLEWFKTRSFAFVSYKDEVVVLYRGTPLVKNISLKTLLDASETSIEWAMKNQAKDGKFLYYYDAVKDSNIDHEHPNMLEPKYYNMLRHSGGIIALLHMYSVNPSSKYLISVEKAIDYLLSETIEEKVETQTHAYVMCNAKAKLGGSGIALVALMMHYMATQKNDYIKIIEALVRHMLSRIDDNGEMIGYYIHPDYYEGKAILNPTEKEKKELFSFYYPGEALLGLALYHNEMSKINKNLKIKIINKSKQALDFLIYERPKRYPEMFATLPSDSWLMQAIEAWAKNESFQKEAYLNFVYEDAKAMIRQMYTQKSAPYFDYIGAYHYYYGEHAYPDAARSEGLIAAYNLARNMNAYDIADYLLPYLKLAAKNMMYVYNSEPSSFAHLYPVKSLGSFRLKYTRQWTRIDMTQHAVSFFMRLYLTLQKEKKCQ